MNKKILSNETGCQKTKKQKNTTKPKKTKKLPAYGDDLVSLLQSSSFAWQCPTEKRRQEFLAHLSCGMLT